MCHAIIFQTACEVRAGSCPRLHTEVPSISTTISLTIACRHYLLISRLTHARRLYKPVTNKRGVTVISMELDVRCYA
jgi:hypothetical protein